MERLTGQDKARREPEFASPRLGLYLFRVHPEPASKLLAQVSVTGPRELPPAPPWRARVDVLVPGEALLTRELVVSNDGKPLAL